MKRAFFIAVAFTLLLAGCSAGGALPSGALTSAPLSATAQATVGPVGIAPSSGQPTPSPGVTSPPTVTPSPSPSATPAPTWSPAPRPSLAPKPSPSPSAGTTGALWVDETKPNNPDALFHLGMTWDELTGAIAKSGLAISDQDTGYIVAPPMYFGNSDGRTVDFIAWDTYSAQMNIPTVNGFDASSTIVDVENALGKPLAACIQDGAICFLYQSGGQYTEYYADASSPFDLTSFHVTSSLDENIANPDYNDYDTVQALIDAG